MDLGMWSKERTILDIAECQGAPAGNEVIPLGL